MRYNFVDTVLHISSKIYYKYLISLIAILIKIIWGYKWNYPICRSEVFIYKFMISLYEYFITSLLFQNWVAASILFGWTCRPKSEQLSCVLHIYRIIRDQSLKILSASTDTLLLQSWFLSLHSQVFLIGKMAENFGQSTFRLTTSVCLGFCLLVPCWIG